MQPVLARPSLAYVPGLDGLRALAVLAVLLYHHNPALLPGGFLGVELFFVLSGYLITALLWFEWRASGRIDLRAFWLRRVRRLLPAMVALVGASLLFTVLWLYDELARLRGDALAALLYVANWHLIVDERPYFASFGRPSLLLHLWSLAIEEQFYLLWPPILLLGLRFLGTRLMFGLALLGAFTASVWMAVLYHPEADLTRVYYGTDTRASGLLLGAALALCWPPRLVQPLIGDAAAPWRDLLGMLALLGLGFFFLYVHEFQPWLYQGGFLLLGLLAVTAIAALARPGAGVCQMVLGLPPLRWLGTRSYSIYLWHWPMFVLTRPGLDLNLDGPALFALRLSLTLILAELSYRLVEQPFRHGAIGQAWRDLQHARGPQRIVLTLHWLLVGGLAVGLTTWLVVEATAATPPAPPDYLAALETSAPPVPFGAAPVSAAPPVILSTPRHAPPPGLGRTNFQAGREPLSPPLISPGPATTRDPRQRPPAPPPSLIGQPTLALGDSIMLGAAPALSAALPGLEVDAAVSRQASGVLAIVRERRATGTLPALVVVHLGNNGHVTADQARELAELLAETQRVVLINTAVPRSWQRPNNETLAIVARSAPNVVLVDWRAATEGRYDLFWGDGVHLRPEGAQLLAELVAEALR